jgi:hypothetical protein
MTNITYLIGAGASIGAIPIVSGISARMKFFASYMDLALTRKKSGI